MTARDPLRDIIGTCAAQIGAIATPVLSPLIIGGLIVGLSVGEIEAGTLITIELLLIGITSMLLAPMMARISHHKLAITGALILILGHVLSSLSTELTELYLWRALAAFGGGCLVATVNAAIAQARSPTLLYGLAWAAAYTVTAILAVVITETNDLISFDIVFRYLAIAIALILPLLWFVPRHGGESIPIAIPAGSIGIGCLLLLGIMLIGISMMAYYAFLGQLALLIGANAAQTGWIIAIAQIAGIIGGLSAAPLSKRLGVIAALTVTSGLHALIICVAIWTDNINVLGVTAFCEAVLFIIMIPLMLTLAANIDKQGRWAAAAGGVFTMSTAFGPIIGALLIESTGYQGVAWLQIIATIPAVFIFLRVNRFTKNTN
ncbi:MAG: MFS transporter [Gammaproteobacteria bacterium]|jgi:predicted MFS family arabinose efflux permease|nr:MFS transporter [Gammaproteobacteria bacterium]